jgi:hypothetical protein
MLADLSLGSYNMHRAFVRVDTGTIGNTGLKAFLSYSNTRADNWRGGYDCASMSMPSCWANGETGTVSAWPCRTMTPIPPAMPAPPWPIGARGGGA